MGCVAGCAVEDARLALAPHLRSPRPVACQAPARQSDVRKPSFATRTPMRHTDWWPYALIFAIGVASLLLALRGVSRQWAGRWQSLRRQPIWLQLAALLGLVWIALRLARAGWRPLVTFLVVLGVFALWGEIAVRARR